MFIKIIEKNNLNSIKKSFLLNQENFNLKILFDEIDSNKKIPEKWIMKPNYRNLLNEAMEDDIVLNYAILCKDIHKKNIGQDQSDETRYQNFKKSKSPEKKFISYINPYSRNYFDSPIKKQIMNNYCLSIKKDNNNYKRNKNDIYDS